MSAFQPRIPLSNLHEGPNAFPSSQHRSMAKRTVAAAEETMRGKSTERKASRAAFFELFEGREGRAAKRQEILERADQRRVRFTKGISSPLSMLSEARDERDEDFGRAMEEVVEAGL